MYFNKNNNFFHGIMFHHFHDRDKHKKSQGSISKDEFYKLIKYIGRENIINADLFYQKLKENKLSKHEVCFTFDDSVKCQMDVALPVLEDLKIKSFFFIYSSIFEYRSNNLEVYRFFRTNFFKNMEEFYQFFYQFVDKDLSFFFKEKENILKEKKMKFPHYSYEDLKFRMVRDHFFDKKEYDNIMKNLMKEKNFKPELAYADLFLNKSDILNLNNLGHTIGLHTHNHPMTLEKLDKESQKFEYEKNLQVLSELLGKKKDEFKSMSHPCGSYNEETLKILKELGVEIGFKQIMKIEKERGMKKINNSHLEIARQDHAEIIHRMDK